MFKELNDFVAGILPGWKTQLASAVTVVTSAAAVGVDYMSGFTNDQWKLLVGEWGPYVTMFSGLAAMWFRSLATRIEDAVK